MSDRLSQVGANSDSWYALCSVILQDPSAHIALVSEANLYQDAKTGGLWALLSL
jgi:hypothetical protein